VTVLSLTPQQIVTIKTKRVVLLTAEQKATLGRAAGKAPTVLSIHSLAVAGRDCTCGEYNFAIWFKPGLIEVPHRFLETDEEAARIADEWEGPESPPSH
jgi:hypothetical protein